MVVKSILPERVSHEIVLRLAVEGSARVDSCSVFHIHLRERNNYLDSGIIGNSAGSFRNKKAFDFVRGSCNLTKPNFNPTVL